MVIPSGSCFEELQHMRPFHLNAFTGVWLTGVGQQRTVGTQPNSMGTQMRSMGMNSDAVVHCMFNTHHGMQAPAVPAVAPWRVGRGP